ncbi:MAG: OmpH family outer membrane protein [Pyrinomonadaceae bacterium]
MTRKPSLLLSALAAFVLSSTAAAQRPAAPTSQPTSTPAPATSPTSAALPNSKIALIYTEAFMDPKTGIAKFTSLISRLNGEFQKQRDDLKQSQQRASQLQDEITKLQNAPASTPIDARSVQAKMDQLDQLKKDIQRKGEDAQAGYNRRRDELFAPLQQEIGKALEAYAKAHGIHIILDGSQVPLAYVAESIDITRVFINDFNSKNPVTASVTPPQKD